MSSFAHEIELQAVRVSTDRASAKSRSSIDLGLPTLPAHNSSYSSSQDDRRYARPLARDLSAPSSREGSLQPTRQNSFHSFSSEVPIVALPPVDGGRQAWLYLAGAFVLELLVWSIPFSYGVFLDYYRAEVFPNDTSLLSLIGSLSSGLLYLLSLVIVPLFARYPTHRGHAMQGGLVLCVAGLLGASFAQTPMHLLLGQGVAYSLGGSVLYFAASSFLWEWFAARRGFANGIIFAGTGCGGLIMPLLIEFLLKRYGHRWALRVVALLFAVLVPPCLPFIKSRLPPSQVVRHRKVNWAFIHRREFWILLVGNTLQGFGNFIPQLYIPSFATHIGLSTTAGTLCLSLLNAASVPGLVFQGTLSDRNLPAAMLFSTIGAGLNVLLIWGLAATNLAWLLVFSIVNGLCSGGYSALWPRKIAAVALDDPSQTLTLYSIFVASRGLGNILSSPLSNALLSHGSGPFRSALGGYGVESGSFGSLIVFTGVTLLTSSLGALFHWFPTPSPRQQQDFDSATVSGEIPLALRERRASVRVVEESALSPEAAEQEARRNV